MHQRLIISLWVVLSLLLAACGSSAGTAASVTPSPSAGTAASVTPSLSAGTAASVTPSASAAALLRPYAIQNSVIFNGLHQAVYDAALYYGEDRTAWVTGLTEESGALYFIEGSAKISGVSRGCDVATEDATSAIVRIDGEGGSRQVLHAVSTGGLFAIQPFAGYMFFAESLQNDVSIGYIDLLGGEARRLALPPVGGAYCYDAWFVRDGKNLVVTMRYYHEATDVATDVIYRVDEALSVTPES